MMASTRQYTFTILFLITSIIVLGMSFYSMRMAHRIADVHAPLVDAALEVKLELTRAHLLFEEFIVGDTHLSMNDVLHHIQEAKWYIHAMAFGDENAEGQYIPIDSHTFQHGLLSVNNSITTLETLMQKRLLNRGSALPGSRADEQFDQYYDNILMDTDEIENDLLLLIKSERKSQKISNYIGFFLLCLLLFGVLYFNFTQRRREIKLLNRLKTLATQDELTKLPNRRSFNKTYNKEWSYALRGQTPLAIAMCDIDFFKAYNDTLGHQAGDDCLKKVANVMKILLKRDIDCVARYGGEEFIFVLPITKKEGAQWVMDKLHEKLAEAKIKHPASEISQCITISIGIAVCIPRGKNKEELIEAADKALYQAKEQGRNRTVLA